MLKLLLTRLTKFARDNCQSWIITWLLNIQILNSHINVSQHNVTCSLPKYCPNIAPNSKNPLRLCQRSHLGRCFSFDGLLCLMKVWINKTNCLIFGRQQDSIPPKVLEVGEIGDVIVSANLIAATLQSFDKEQCLCQNCGVFWRTWLWKYCYVKQKSI